MILHRKHFRFDRRGRKHFSFFFKNAWSDSFFSNMFCNVCRQILGYPVVLDCLVTISHEVCAGRSGSHHLPDYDIWFTVYGLQRRKLRRPSQ